MNLRKGFSALIMAMFFVVTASMSALADVGTKTATFDTGRIPVSERRMVIHNNSKLCFLCKRII